MAENLPVQPQADAGPAPDRARSLGGLKVEAYTFFAISAFFLIATVVYGMWSPEWSTFHTVEMAGTVALLLTGLMLALIGSFIWFGSRRLERPRPEDDLEAEVADGAGDVGFFSPASYWPLALAAAGMLLAISIAFWLVWLVVIGFGFLLLALCGLLFEYQRAHVAH